jgi:hypothetical protein
MKTLSIHILYSTLLLLAFAGCKKSEKLMYREDPRVYFSKYATNPDSVIYSFAIQPDNRMSDTVYLTMRIMGTATDYDREIGLAIADTSTAVRGYHFDLGDLVMPANQYETRIPVVLYRKPGLKDSLVTIDFTVVESKDFKPGYDDIPSTIYKKTRLQYKVVLNDYLLKPTRWDCCLASYLGTYSEVKFRFVIQTTGKTDWDDALGTTPGIMSYVSQAVRLALYEYEQVNGPLIDENGEQVTFP